MSVHRSEFECAKTFKKKEQTTNCIINLAQETGVCYLKGEC